MKKVVKFGGSSLASAKQFKKVGDIIRADKSRRYVVPSAPGKRNSGDTKVTDLLYQMYDAAGDRAKYSVIFKEIRSRFEEIIEGLGLTLNLDDEFRRMEENFVHQIGRDYAASRGEYLNGLVMAAYLGYEFVDPAEMIVFHDDGTLDAEETQREVAERLEQWLGSEDARAAARRRLDGAMALLQSDGDALGLAAREILRARKLVPQGGVPFSLWRPGGTRRVSGSVSVDT